jgi:ribonuclease P protein component
VGAPAEPQSSSKQGQRLPRSDRILRRSDYLRVQREGRKVHTEHFVVMVLAASRQRLGVTVTRRTAGAVGRNRVRRLVREVFRRRRELFPERCELVLVARAGAQRLDYAALERELADASPALLRVAQNQTAPTRNPR